MLSDEDLQTLMAMNDAFGLKLAEEYLKVQGKNPEAEVMLLSLMIDSCNMRSVILKYVSQEVFKK